MLPLGRAGVYSSLPKESIRVYLTMKQMFEIWGNMKIDSGRNSYTTERRETRTEMDHLVMQVVPLEVGSTQRTCPIENESKLPSEEEMGQGCDYGQCINVL